MFYSTEVLAKKGPLGSIWLAATMARGRVPRKVVTESDISSLSKNIAEPEAPFALRLSATLMYGLVVLYDQKCAIMLKDANKVFIRVKQSISFSVASVNLSQSEMAAPEKAITLQKKSGHELSDFDLAGVEQSRVLPVWTSLTWSLMLLRR
eukprot:Rmarinus@m.14746